GLDIKELPHVVNYELPNVPEDYVHRIGRTARAGGAGSAVSLVAPDEAPLLRDIERLLRRSLPVSPLPEFPVSAPSRQPSHGDAPAHRPQGERRDGGHNAGGGRNPGRQVRRDERGSGQRTGDQRGSDQRGQDPRGNGQRGHDHRRGQTQGREQRHTHGNGSQGHTSHGHGHAQQRHGRAGDVSGANTGGPPRRDTQGPSDTQRQRAGRPFRQRRAGGY